MKAFTLDAFDSPPRLRDDLPELEGEVIVRVAGSSVNAVDAAIASGMLRGMAEYRFPVTLGRDYAGVVEQGAGRLSEGDAVYGFVLHANPDVHDGAWAERVAIPEAWASPAPASLSLAGAGVAPLAGLTALAAIDALELTAGETLLIVGATGGVGSFAAQLAERAGARVIAPALPEDEEYLRGLGVEEIVERGGALPEADAVLDLVSYSPDQVPAAGRVASPLGAAGEGPGRFNVMASPDPAGVARLTALLEDGVRVTIQRSYPLERAGEAQADFAAQHTQGKLAIEIG